VSSSVSVTASASDNVGVAGVQFKLDGANLGTEVTSSPYTTSWNTSTATNGTHSITAVARDAAGNSTTSAAVSVTVNNTAAVLLGSQTIQATADSNSAGEAEGFKFTATATGTAAQMKFYVDTGNAATALKLGIYTNNGTHPGTLLASGSITSPVSAAWNTVTMSAGANLVSGTVYWIAILGTGGQLNYRDASGTNCSEDASPLGVSALPTTWVSGAAWSSCNISAYVTASGGASDTTAPTTSITSPTAGATIGGTATVSATASDNVGVTKVELYVDGTLNSTLTSSPYNFSLNTTTLTNATHSLTTKAYDAAGNVGTSAAVSVTVFNDTTAPVTSITSPVNSATIGGNAAVSATATDNVGVTKVELYADGALKSTLTTSPYNFTLATSGLSNGSHTLTTKAYDAAGNIGTSTAVTVTVFNDTTAPSVPAGLTATSAGMSAINLSWTASTDNVAVTGYRIRRGGTVLGTTTSTTYGDTGLASGTNYSYTVTAYDAAGNESAQSTAASATTATDTVAPTTPTGLTQSGATATTATLSWTASTDNVAVTGYHYYNAGATALGTTTATSVTYTGLSCGQTFSAGVDAYDAAGNVSAKVTTNLTTSACDTTAPTVSITAPAAGATVSATTSISATAADNVAVAGVQFKLDGANLGTEVTASPYTFSWNTSTATEGAHTITAVARDTSGNTTTSTSVSVTVSNASTLVVFDKQVSTNQSSASTTITSPAITTAQANELLVAFVTSDGPTTSGGQSISTVTGGSLTWNMRKRVNTQYGTSEIWTAPAAAVQTNVTVTATRASGSYTGSITVAAFKNASLSAVGATAGSNAATGAPATSLVSTKANSLVWGAGNDWDGATSRTVGTGQTMVNQFVATAVGDTFWVQNVTNATTAIGQTVTVNDTAPTNHRWNLAAIEIIPAN
jgi:chitodextrinase